MEALINKQEVLRYLGYRGQEIGAELNSDIDRAIAECGELAAPRVLWRIFDITRENKGIRVGDTPLVLTGYDIAARLKGAEKAALVAATLGIGVDNAISRYSLRDTSYSLLLDASATACIEAVMDRAENELRVQAEKDGLKAASRFSPGYGDLSLDIQPLLLEILQARRIGLTCTHDFFMLPGKSVTAVIGLGKQIAGCDIQRCKGCKLEGSCGFKNK